MSLVNLTTSGTGVRAAGPRERPASALSARPARRVRQEVRDGVAVIVFSAAASTAVAVTIAVVVSLVG